MARKMKWFLMAGVLFLVSSCYYDKEDILYPGGDNCSTTVKKFATEVNPLIQSKCAIASDCHASGSTNAGGPLTNYDQIKSKTIIIRHQVVTGAMPKTGSLSNEELKTIVCWIDSGSPQN